MVWAYVGAYMAVASLSLPKFAQALLDKKAERRDYEWTTTESVVVVSMCWPLVLALVVVQTVAQQFRGGK